MKRVLIIDDDVVFLTLTSKFLKKNKLDVETFESWALAKDRISNSTVDIVLVDLYLADITGIQIIQEIKQTNPEMPILMITAHSSIQTAIESVKAGADDYIQKPCDNSEILFKIQRVFKNAEKETELKTLKETVEGQFSFRHLVTKDEETKKVYQLSKIAADLDILIFISGETGSGKEVLAKTIHMASIRAKHPFVIFNCAAINENLVESELFGHKKGSFTSAYIDKKGLCEVVGKGTLFIDEIGELSMGVQKKLLRLLQEHEFESVGSTTVQKFRGRVITASHRDLKKMIKQKQFREDLFFRLNVFPLHLTPLRDKTVDIMDLSRLFLNRYATKYNKKVTDWTSQTVKLMMAYKWPGNIRELEHFIERQVLISKKSIIDIKEFDAFGGIDLQSVDNPDEKKMVQHEYNDFMKSKEKEYLARLLKSCKGSIDKASSIANIHRKTLYVKLKEHNLDKKGFK